ncbi:low temperature requirement protein A [Microbacterium hominis]|uniref:Low temperature requirement protein A n=1 Tax=Microbacterium hominis TaxID=162426 RepID=A0A7D4U635_9MICO|nr:low temperature requirement protein A [Microbacterium hominis]QKJ18026.1 low temperature requirement protein A [Microbacterium hominis]
MTSGSTRPRRPHGLVPMSGRNPRDAHRAATPLELLYDLTLVVAFSIAGSEFAHSLAAGHVVSGLLAFLFCMFAIIWAWMTFAWFASAYDTDDWGFRIATLVQMLGVTILALGIGDLFAGFDEGRLDNAVIVVGYVIMRLSMISLWLRAARNDPEHRPVLLGYVKIIGAAQIGWIITAFPLPVPVLLALMTTLYLTEVGGSAILESREGRLPIHPHHIAERFGLLGIITFGEVVLGTTTAVGAVTVEVGWTVDAAVLAFSGIAMVVGMWWVYFALPHGEILSRRRDLAVRWAYSHLVLYSAIAAVGAGLHAVAYYLEHHSELDAVATTLTVAIPLLVYVLALYAAFHLVLPGRDPVHTWLIVATVATIAGAVGLAMTGVSIAWPVLVLTAAPWISVVGYEVYGDTHARRVLETL